MQPRLIVNPHAGRGAGRRLARRISRRLAACGLSCRASFSRAPGDILAQAEAAARAGHDPVIVAGGDGSVYEAVNGLMRAARPVRFGVVPLGTGNDFVKVTGIPRDWSAACERIAELRTRLIDIGRCNDTYFANGIGVGFDAEVAQAARHIPCLRGDLVYFVALFRVLLRGVSAPRVRVEDEHGRIERPVTLVAIANGRYYGGAFNIAPTAEIDDGWLEVVVADAVGRGGVLRFAPRVIAGTHLSLPIVQHHRARRITLVGEGDLCVHADGEILPATRRLDIEILPQRLRLLV